jgi:hypothetical protein
MYFLEAGLDKYNSKTKRLPAYISSLMLHDKNNIS